MNRRPSLIGESALGLVAFGGGGVLLKQQRQVGAKVTLVEFFDLSCEACRAHHPVVQEIGRQFPAEVRVAQRCAVFHEGSDEAMRILEAARAQDMFEPMLNALLEEQPGWAGDGAPQLDVAWEIAESDRLFPGIAAVLNQDTADVRFAVEHS